jgi:5-methylcytosine-specific restriction endonuclease McrA
MPEISAALRAEVRSRAAGRCEYCLVPEKLTLVPHEVDHIIATKHGGGTPPAIWHCVARSATSTKEATSLPSTRKVVKCSAYSILAAINGTSISNCVVVRSYRSPR